MKKFLTLVSAIAISLAVVTQAFAASNLLAMRNKIFNEAKEIKSLMPATKDAYLASSMWDSCVLSISQLDAYFSMLGIFNTIRKENVTQASVDYISGWLREVKSSTELNIKGLNSITDPIEPNTKTHLGVLRGYFEELNGSIDAELNKVAALRRTSRAR